MTSTFDVHRDSAVSFQGSPTSTGATPEYEGEPELAAIPAPAQREQKSHCRKKPADHIPRPRNAFIIFRSDFVAQKRVPGSIENNHQNISKIAGAVWKVMSNEDKKEWYRRAEEEKEEHARQYPGYQYNPAGLSETATLGKRRRVVHKGRGVEDRQACELKCKYVAGLLAGGQTGVALEDAVKERNFLHEVKEIRADDTASITPLAVKKAKVPTTRPAQPRHASVAIRRKELQHHQENVEIYPMPNPRFHQLKRRQCTQASLSKPKPVNPMSLASLLHPASVGETKTRTIAPTVPPLLSKDASPTRRAPVNSYIGLPFSTFRDKASPCETTHTSERNGYNAPQCARSSPPSSLHTRNIETTHDNSAESTCRRDAGYKHAVPRDTLYPTLRREEEPPPTRPANAHSCSHTRSQRDIDMSDERSSDSSETDCDMDYGRCYTRNGTQHTASRSRSPSPDFYPVERTYRFQWRGRSRAASVEMRTRSPSPDVSSPLPSPANPTGYSGMRPLPFKARTAIGDTSSTVTSQWSSGGGDGEVWRLNNVPEGSARSRH